MNEPYGPFNTDKVQYQESVRDKTYHIPTVTTGKVSKTTNTLKEKEGVKMGSGDSCATSIMHRSHADSDLNRCCKTEPDQGLSKKA